MSSHPRAYDVQTQAEKDAILAQIQADMLQTKQRNSAIGFGRQTPGKKIALLSPKLKTVGIDTPISILGNGVSALLGGGNG